MTVKLFIRLVGEDNQSFIKWSKNKILLSDVDNAERREYLAALWRMDFQVGRVVEKLKESGEYDNTLIIFQSDNGPTGQGRNYPLRGYKQGF